MANHVSLLLHCANECPGKRDLVCVAVLECMYVECESKAVPTHDADSMHIRSLHIGMRIGANHQY